jgi:transcriptional regulator with XRE-family HTH domain
MTPALLIRNARQTANLSQAELARRLGTTQSAVARLEGLGSNPQIETLERALAACGEELILASRPTRSSIDESQVVELLRMPPAERLKVFERSYANVRELALAAAQSRGDLA